MRFYLHLPPCATHARSRTTATHAPRRLALAQGETSVRLVRVSRVLAATPGSDSERQKPNASAKTAELIEDPMLATLLPKAATSA